MRRGSIIDYKETMEKVADCAQLTGLSNVQLAREVGVSDVLVSQWYSGKTFPNLDTLVKIAEVFDMYVDDLIVRKEV